MKGGKKRVLIGSPVHQKSAILSRFLTALLQLRQNTAEFGYCFIDWNEQLIWKVADFKISLISKAIEFKYDYILLIDSDVLLHPGTVDQLLAAKKRHNF